MRGKLKMSRKKKYIIVAIIAILIISFLTAEVYYNISKNLKTNLGKASTSNYPFSGTQIVKKGLELSTKTTHYDCSGFVSQVLVQLGAKNIQNGNTTGWSNKSFTFDYDNTTYGLANPIQTATRSGSQYWYNATGLKIDELQAGDIIVGGGHMFIYIGKYNDVNSLENYIDSLGINETAVRINDNNKLNTGSCYWYVEGNASNYYPPTIRNYNWGISSGSKNMDSIKVYRISKPKDGSYHVNFGKKSNDDPDGNYVSGIKFNVGKTINGGTKPTSEVTTDTKLSNIETVAITNLTVDKYTFEEKESPGYQTRGGIYGVNVYKKISGDKYVIDHITYLSGSGTQLITQDIKTGEKYWILSNRYACEDSKVAPGQKKEAIAYIELASNGANFNYIAFDKPITGSYHMNVKKQEYGDTSHTDANSIGGAEFSITRRINMGTSSDPYTILSNKGKVANASGENYNSTSKTCNGNVTINNINSDDYYTIKEIKAPDGYSISGNNWNIGIRVKKEIVGNKYVIKSIGLEGANGNILTITRDATKSTFGMLGKDLKETTEISKCVIHIEVGKDGNAFNVTWRDPKLEGKYTVNLSKINKSTKEKISGIKFGVTKNSEATKYVTTTDKNVEISSETITKDNLDVKDHYTLTEDITAASEINCIAIKDPIEFYVVKGYDSTTNKYQIKGISTIPEITTEKSLTFSCKDLAENDVNVKIQVNSDSTSIDITAENEKAENYKFEIKKVDADNDSKFLTETLFTINKTIADYNNSINPITERLKDMESLGENGIFADESLENNKINKLYTYTIKEDEPEIGYINVFGEDVYIKVDVKLGTDGNIDEEKTKVKLESISGANTEDKEKYIEKLEINQENHVISLIIKNPKQTADMSIELYKHELNSNEGVTGAGFTAYKTNSNWENSVQLTSFSTINGESNLIENIEKSEFNTTYYYEIEENTVPSNFVNTVTKARFKVGVDANGNYFGNIVQIMKSGKNVWENYNDDTDGNSIKIEQNGSKFTLKIANSVRYDFTLYKKNYVENKRPSESDIFTGEATFLIEEIISNTQTNKVYEGNLQNAQAAFSKIDAKSNTTYKYKITETNVSNGYYKTLVNKPIIVSISIGADGKLKCISKSGSNWCFDSSLNLSTNEANLLSNYIDFEVVNNQISLYIVNMKENYYSLQLVKVDKNGKTITSKEAQFTVESSSNVPSENGVDIGSATSSGCTTNGILNVASNSTIKPGYKDTYLIEETKAPEGYIPLRGKIEVNVNFTDKGDLIKDNIELTYKGTDAIGEKVSFEFNTDSTIPIIQIFIPNDGKQFEFELLKEDKNGNIIKAETDNNGNIDGAEFSISRMHVHQVPNTSTNVTSDDFFSGSVINDVLENGVVNDKVLAFSNLVYTYTINEVKSKSEYVNFLKNYQINLTITTDADSNINSVDYTVIDTLNHGASVTNNFKERYGNNIELKVNDTKDKVTIIIKNTPGYKVKLSKTDNTSLERQVSHVVLIATNLKTNETVKLNGNGTNVDAKSTVISNEDFVIGMEEEQTWKITEEYVSQGCTNILLGKYIEATVKMTTDGLILKNYSIKNLDDNTEVTDIKKYVNVNITEENNEKILNVTVKDPKNIILKLRKTEADGETPLSGAKLKIESIIGEKLSGTGEIKDGSTEYTEKFINNTTYRSFKIIEESSPANHRNILENKYIIVVTHINQEGEVKVDSVKIYQKDTGEELNENDDTYNWVKVNITPNTVSEDVPQTIDINVLNPVDFKIEINKVDSSNEKEPLSNTYFTIADPILSEKIGELSFNEKNELIKTYKENGIGLNDINGNGEISAVTTDGLIRISEENITAGKTYEYKFNEIMASSTRLTNLFKDNSIYIKVKVADDGSILLENYANGKNCIIKDSKGTEVKEEYYKYVNIKIDKTGTTACVKIEIINPTNIELKISKRIFGNEGYYLDNVTFQINSPISGAHSINTTNGYINLNEDNVSEGDYEYIIKEIAANNDDIVNILDGDYTKFKVHVAANGTVSFVKNAQGNNYGIYKQSDNSVVNLKDELVNVTIDGSGSTGRVNIDVVDPQKYAIKIQKKDSNTKENIKGIVFNAIVYDEQENEIKLKDATTMEEKSLTELTTDDNGEINISNILFENAGKYILMLNESNSGIYVPVDTIKIEVTIEYVNGKYKITKMEPISGEEAIEEFKITENSGINTIELGINNEKIKGSYNLTINKLDESSRELIDGATFNIEAFDMEGNPIELYESNNDPKSKIKLISKSIEIKDGVASINNIRIENEGQYKLKFTETAQPKGYKKLVGPFEITVETKIQYNGTNTSYVVNKIEESPNNPANIDIVSEEHQITIDVPNESINGQYKLSLLKKSSETGDVIQNIPFDVNNKEMTTDENGSINVIRELTETMDTYLINAKNYEKNDVYVVKELENENTKDYAVIENPITVEIQKGIDSNEEAYVVKQINIQYTNTRGTYTLALGVNPYTHTLVNNGEFYVKTKDGVDRKAIISMNIDGELTLELVNPKKSGEYSLQLYKSCIDNNENESALSQTEFTINDLKKITDTNGYTTKIARTITSDNLANEDEYTITEISTDDNTIIQLKNSLKLVVTKGINNDNNGYVIKTIKLSEDNTIKATPTVAINEETGATVTLSEVQLKDGRTVNIVVTTTNTELILVKIQNRKMEGKYTLKVRKIDSATNKAINGVVFSGLDSKKIGFTRTTANDGIQDGIATIVEDEKITGITSYYYQIKEMDLPDSIKGDYLQLTDYGLGVSISTKMNDAKNEYIVDNVVVQPAVTGGSPTTADQKEIIEKTEVDTVNNVITITVYNEPTVDYELKIRKADMQNKSIADAKFTIKENGVVILENAKLGDLGEHLITKENQVIDKTYSYEIYETEAAPGYDNVLEKAHILLKIIIDSQGKISTNMGFWPNDNGTIIDVVTLRRIYAEYLTNNAGMSILEKDEVNNSYTLNIPNPKATTPISFTLNKHETNSENGVAGAVFTNKKLYVSQENSVDLTSILNKFNVGTDIESLNSIITNTTDKNLSIDSVNSVYLGDSCYYEVSEDAVPKNYTSNFKKALVRIHANLDKTISANIVAVIPYTSNEWVQYTTNNDITTSVDGTNVSLNWANALHYTVLVNKKQFKSTIPKDDKGNTIWSGLEGLPGATFTVKEVSPEVKTIYNEQVLSDLQFFNNEEAHSSTTYHYTIQETASRDGYNNIFEGVTIHLYITTNADGSINKLKNATYCEIEGNLSSVERKYLEDKVGLDVSGNSVSIYILNEQKTLKIALMKVADTQLNGKLEGIPGVVFNVLDPHQIGSTMTTDSDGYAYINEIELNTGSQIYVFTESSVPDGVTKNNDTIILRIADTTGRADPEQLTSDDISISLGSGSTLRGLSAKLEGTTILLTVPNPVKNYVFNMFKYDEIGNIINNSDKIKAPTFVVSQLNENNEYEEVYRGELSDGMFKDFEFTKANAIYEYKIEELDSKDGYLNILKGYNLYVHIETDENSKVKTTANDGYGGYTRYRLETKTGETQLYTEGEIVTNKYIILNTNIGDTSASVALSIQNPYKYNLRLNKKSKTGNLDVNKATILAEEISNVRANDLFMATQGTNYNKETIQTILKEIVTSTNKLNEVKLDKKSTITSNDMEIKYNRSMMPLDATTKTWRITETDVDAPYINVLGDNYVVVQAYYREGTVVLSEHQEEINGVVQTFNYYVCNKNGENITSQYANAIDVVIDGKNEVSVTVKDPTKFYVDLNKVEYNPEGENKEDFTPLSGAELTITSNGTTKNITNGATTSESIVTEVGPGDVTTFTIQESKSAINHTNVLQDKVLNVMVRVNETGNASIVGTVIVDTKLGKPLVNDEKNEIFKYVKFFIETNDDGYPMIHVYVQNPIEYKFKLQKLDTAGKELTGTQIEVSSSVSGKHYLDELPNMEFFEENLIPGQIVSYSITEKRTVANSAYVNVFNHVITMVLRVENDGHLTDVMSFMEIPSQHGEPDKIPLSEIDFLEYGISIPDSNGIQTVNLELQNPTSITFDLIKKSSGDTDNIRIPNTEFTLISSFSNDHSGLTDSNGEIVFKENEIRAGKYTYKITENKTANDKYVNILDGYYILAKISVAANGNITTDGYELYTKDDVKVTDNAILQKLENYINISIDDSEVIQKVVVEIKNPIIISLELIKESTDGINLDGAEFEITSEIANKTYTEETENGGYINITEDTWIDPGVYKYEIKEIETPGNQYYNILSDNKVVFYVKVDSTGNITLVSDKNGTDFATNYENKYFIKDENNNNVSESIKNKIYERIKILLNNSKNDISELMIDVINPVNQKMKIVKKNADGENIDGAKFTVIRNNKETLLDRGIITTESEIIEENMEDGAYDYLIVENSTVPNSGYLNILDGKYIKVYTELRGNGVLKIKDQDANTSNDYFEIYEGKISDTANAQLLDKTEYKDLYDLINVSSIKGDDGVYTLAVTVENPDRKYNIKLNKKIFGDENINVSNTKFTVISAISGKHENLVTDKDGNLSFEEKRVKAGTYRYLITETESAGEEIKNILEKVYVEVLLKVNDDGTIQILDSENNVSEGTYRLFIENDNDSIIHQIDFDDTVIDNYITVGTNVLEDEFELDISVKDPEFYNFELVKKDKDTNEKMNRVKFSLSIYDSDNKKVTFRDADTLEEMDTDMIVTKNVNGKDGVISIPNILIEKAGIYTYRLHEESTDGLFDCLYKTHATDIYVKVEIIEDTANGRYIVKDPKVILGEKYVDTVNITETKAQSVQVGITNERIKGSYNLILDKVDSYTHQPLDGAEFSISAERMVEEDGQKVVKPYTVYESNDNVESKNIIIPQNNLKVVNGKLEINNIRIERPETYTLILTETKAPKGYMLLDEPIKIEVSTTIDGENDDAKYVLEYAKLISGVNHKLVSVANTDNEVKIKAENEYFDLALRKSITSINYGDGTDDGKITEEETKDRIPDVVPDKLLSNDDTTAVYNHNKTPIRAYASQYVIYTLRVYNEGEIDGYAQEITDHLPNGLEFVNDEFNTSRGWKYDESDTTLRTVKTTYLSKEIDSENNLIKAFNKETGVVDFKEIQIKCKIADDAKVDTILTNIAEISSSIAKDRTSTTIDRDSTTNNVKVPNTDENMSSYKNDELTKSYVPGQEDDDDFEKVIIKDFDLALRKYITELNDEKVLKSEDTEEKDDNKDIINEDTEDNSENTDDKETNDKTDSDESNDKTSDEEYAREPIVNVDSLKDGSDHTATYTHTKEPIEVSVGDIVTYTLQVYNEGSVSGYAKEIKDNIPEGLEYVKDNEVNKEFRWEMLDENEEKTDDVTKAKYVVSDYLAKENESEENANLINAFDKESDKLDSKFVKISFKVICTQDFAKIIENKGEISDDSDESGKSVKDRDSTPDVWNEGEDDQDREYVKVTYLDLALRKFITGVNKEEVTNRIPKVDATVLIDETGTTATYEHTKEPVLVHTSDKVTYTLRVYNEGSKNGYATQIKDDIPDGLEFVNDDEINEEYGWKLVDENDNETTDVTKAKYVVTDYLSKEKETKEGEYLLKAFDKETMTTPDYRDVRITFKVVEPTTSSRIVINEAQISKETDGAGIVRDDRDSVPNVWQGEDDEDIEKVRVEYFDLALRKWVTKAIVTENGKTVVTETGHHAEDDPEEVVKVDLKKSKLDSVVVKFEYQIRVTNEGEIAGYAKELKDHIPQGLRFEATDNPNWAEVEDGIISTDELKDTLLQPGESAEVTVVLTWINGADNMGVKVNVAEISKDYNDYGTPDIDSTPDNYVPGEDDIDDAPVMLTVKTGAQEVKYMIIAAGVLGIIALGVSLIKEKVTKEK